MAASPFILLLALATLAVLAILAVLLITKLVQGVTWVLAHIGHFVIGELTDALRVVGALLAWTALIPLILGCVVIGRWSAAAHFSRSWLSELGAIWTGLWRIAVAHPLNLLLLTPVADGIGRRIPEAVRAAPGRDAPTPRTGQFQGYTIIGSLKGGGSGGKLYVAKPDEIRLAALERQGHRDVDRVVIKAFSLRDGSSLPQIVRESRALDAAKKLDLVLDHRLDDERFYYVMRYVPGDPLGLVTTRLHAASNTEGLDDQRLAAALGYVRDLLTTLNVYHRGGLWHKDVKPDNIIINRSGAHLVDLGLVTPLRSAMTLTTHGTEYFRDPELVRMALKGVKVHQVDGAKFDIYAAGAVLYSILENSFPAHGGLSQITRRCPDATRWIVRRAMAEYDHRYSTTGEMLADLCVVLDAQDPFSVKPADLPSVRQSPVSTSDIPEVAPPPVEPIAQDKPQARGPVRAPAESHSPPHPHERARPSLKITNWWTGRCRVDDRESVAHARTPHVPRAADAPRGRDARPGAGAGVGLTAPEQLHRARSRAQAARQRAQARRRSIAGGHPTRNRRNHRAAARASRRPKHHNNTDPSTPAATVVGLIVVVGLTGGILTGMLLPTSESRRVGPGTGSASSVADASVTVPNAAPDVPAQTQQPPTVTRRAQAIETPVFEAGASGIVAGLFEVVRTVRRSETPSLATPGGAVAGVGLVAAQAAEAGARVLMAQQRVLIVKPSTRGLTPRRELEIDALLSELDRLGVHVVGEPTSAVRPPLAEPLAELQYLVDQGDSPDQLDRIAAWIDRTQGVDYVIRLAWAEHDRPADIRLFNPPRDPNRPERLDRVMANAGIEHAIRAVVLSPPTPARDPDADTRDRVTGG